MIRVSAVLMLGGMFMDAYHRATPQRTTEFTEKDGLCGLGRGDASRFAHASYGGGIGGRAGACR